MTRAMVCFALTVVLSFFSVVAQSASKCGVGTDKDGVSYASSSDMQTCIDTNVTPGISALCGGSGTYEWSMNDSITSQSLMPNAAVSDSATLVYHQTLTRCDGNTGQVGVLQVWYWDVPATTAADCSSVASKFFEWSSSFGPLAAGSWTQTDANGTAASLYGAYVCSEIAFPSVGTCRARITIASCTVNATDDACCAASGGLDETCSGTAQFSSTGTACVAGDRLAKGLPLNTRALTTAGSANGGVTAGGAGVSGGTSADSINAARTASNTDRIARAVEKGSMNSGTTSGAGSCGGDGQPACVVAGQCGGAGQPACAVDEGNTAASTSGVVSSVNSTSTQAGSDLQSVTDAINGTVPTFTGPSGAWSWLTPEFQQLFGTGACFFDQAVSFPGMATFNVRLSVCSFGSYARDILGLVMYAFGGIGVFRALFGHGGGGE